MCDKIMLQTQMLIPHNFNKFNHLKKVANVVFSLQIVCNRCVHYLKSLATLVDSCQRVNLSKCVHCCNGSEKKNKKINGYKGARKRKREQITLIACI